MSKAFIPLLRYSQHLIANNANAMTCTRYLRCVAFPAASPSLLPTKAAASAALVHRRHFAAGGGSGSGATSVPPASSASSNIIAIQDEADFEKRVRSAKQPVMLQFHATWCAPCKLLKPRLEKAVRGKPKLLLATVDVDNLPDVAADYRVVSVPMVVAVHDGRIVDSFVGLRESEAVQDFVDKFAEKHGV